MRKISIKKRSAKIKDGLKTLSIVVNEFNEGSAKIFMETFTDLHSNDDIQQILIVIDSYGGDVSALGVMADLVECSQKPVLITCLGKAMSCGAILLSLGNDRWAGPSSRILFHRVRGMVGGPSDHLENEVGEMKRLTDFFLRKAVAKSKLTWKKFNQLLDRHAGEWYLTPREALRYGFIDRIGVPMIQETTTTEVVRIG